MAVGSLRFMPDTTANLIDASTRFRREANKADNKAATVAVDSLLNYEAVKVLCHHLICHSGI
jgi:ABC-type transport system involved in Fe-S cluster assembly fused permease/ATPase subunit